MFWPAAALALLLSACGGGGSDSGSTPASQVSTETFQLRTAYANAVGDTTTRSFQISGTVSGVAITGSGSATQGALVAASFEGRSAQSKTTTITGSFSAAGTTPVPLAVTTVAYFDSSLNLLGENDDGEYLVVNSATTVPTTARVGDSGTWYTADRYDSSAKTTRQGSWTVTYALDADTASSAILRLTSVERDTSNATVSTTTSRFRMTPAGALTPLAEVYSDSSGSMTLTYGSP